MCCYEPRHSQLRNSEIWYSAKQASFQLNLTSYIYSNSKLKKEALLLI